MNETDKFLHVKWLKVGSDEIREIAEAAISAVCRDFGQMPRFRMRLRIWAIYLKIT